MKMLLCMTVWCSKKMFLSRKVILSKMVLQASATSRDVEDWFFFRMPRFVLEMFACLKMFRGVAKV